MCLGDKSGNTKINRPDLWHSGARRQHSLSHTCGNEPRGICCCGACRADGGVVDDGGFAGVMDAKATASAYYSPILFLILGGAFIALAIERTGLHRRLALFLLRLVGKGGGQTGVLIAFMATAAILSMLISNTSTTLIMMPMALAVLRGGGSSDDQFEGLAGALPMGIAFAASIGGLGTLVGWLAHQRHCGWPAGYTGGHADYLCKMGALWPACGHHRRAAGGVDREPGPERLALFVRYCRRPHLD